MAQLGFRTMDEMIGRSDLLDMKQAIGHYKARGSTSARSSTGRRSAPTSPSAEVRDQDHGLDKALDQQLLPLAAPALERGEPVEIELPIRNVNRTVGTILGSELTRKYGARRAARRHDPDQVHTARPARASAPSCRGG